MKLKQGRKGLTAIKIDMDIAYDRLEWPFVAQKMRCFGFDNHQTSGFFNFFQVSFSVLPNGSAFGFFSPLEEFDGGIQCPSLFSSYVRKQSLGQPLKKERLGILHGMQVARNASSVTHLMFADDLVFFTRANIREIRTVKAILQKYSAWSGQMINQQKSSIAFNRITHAEVQTSFCYELCLRKVRIKVNT